MTRTIMIIVIGSVLGCSSPAPSAPVRVVEPTPPVIDAWVGKDDDTDTKYRSLESARLWFSPIMGKSHRCYVSFRDPLSGDTNTRYVVVPEPWCDSLAGIPIKRDLNNNVYIP